MTRTFILLFIFASTVLNYSVKAQNGTKGIYIMNALTKVPVAEVSIRDNDGLFSAVSDDNGYVDLAKLPVSAKMITISSIGFVALEKPISEFLVKGERVLIGLMPRVSSLQEVKVIASANKGIFKTISDLDIHLRPLNNSQEVLRMVPGLFIGQHAGGGKAEQLFLRGFDLDHGTDINLSVDGMPVNMVSHAHGQGYADLHFLIPELIDKVNFNKGPYFADKGNFTTAGFVSFKTKDYLDNNFVKVEGGQFGTFRTIAGINLVPKKAEIRSQSLYVAGEGSVTKGYFDDPQHFSRFNGILKYHGALSNRQTLSVTVSAFSSKWNASGQIPERAVKAGSVGFYGAIDKTEGGKTSRHNLNIEWQAKLSHGGLLTNQFYYSKYGFELYSNFSFYKQDTVNGDQIRQKENRELLGYNGSYQKKYRMGKMPAETKSGIQLRYDDIKDIELTRTVNRVINTNELMFGNIRELNTGAYFSTSLSVLKKLDITAAIRGDLFSNRYQDLLNTRTLTSSSFMVSPKLNFNYRVNDKVQLYLYSGRGFHSNDTRVAVMQNGKKVVPPAYGIDLGGVFKPGKKLVLQSALWYLHLDQEFVYVGDEAVVEAGGRTRRIGFDLSARYEPVKYLYADVDLSYADPRALGVPRGESRLPLAPVFSSTGGLTYRAAEGFSGSLRYRLMANRPANEDNSVVAKGYCILDAALNFSQKKWEAGLSIQNLLNTRWKETQFDTESRLKNETSPVSEIHFTPGTPFFARVSFTVFF